MWYQPKKEGEWNDRKKQSNRKGNAINTVSYLTFHIQMNLPRLSVLTKAVASLSFHSRAKRRIFELNLLVGPQEYDMSSMQRLMSLKSFRLPNNKHTERIFWLWYRNIHRLVCLACACRTAMNSTRGQETNPSRRFSKLHYTLPCVSCVFLALRL